MVRAQCKACGPEGRRDPPHDLIEGQADVAFLMGVSDTQRAQAKWS